MQKENQKPSTSLIARMAERFGVDGNKLFDTLKVTCFRQRDGSAPTNEQMMSLLIVADQYGLNPFTKEIVAFAGGAGQIVPVVSVDGWSRIINTHPQMDGVEFRYSDNMTTPTGGQLCPEWIEAVIYRKDRRPTPVREYLDEVYQPARKYPGPWQTHTKRMLRHKALIQASRLAFGFSGIYDADEATNIVTAPINQTAVSAANLTQAPARPALSLEELDANVKLLRLRAQQLGIESVEAYIRSRFGGADQDYLLAAVRTLPVQQIELEDPVDMAEHDPAHDAIEADWEEEPFY